MSKRNQSQNFGTKRVKSQRGQAENDYGEVKQKLGTSLTHSALDALKRYANKRGISVTELLEQIVRVEADLVSILERTIKAFHQDRPFPIKRTKRVRGAIANSFGEKKVQTTFSLTPRACHMLQNLAGALGIKKNQSLDYIARSLQDIEPLLIAQNSINRSK